MEGKFILLIQPNAPLRSILYRGLVATGSYVLPVEDEKQIATPLNACQFDLVFADFRLKHIIEHVHARYPETKIVILTDMSPKEVIPYMAERNYLNNMVAVRSIRKLVDIKELIVSTEKLLRNDIFGLDKYLRWGGKIYQEKVDTMTNTGRCIDRVANFVLKLNAKSRLSSIAMDVTDELLKLAFHQNDMTPNPQNTPAPVDFAYAFDGESLFLSAKDYVGNLDKNKVLTYFSQCFSGSSDKLILDDLAGYSIFKIFRAVNHFGINHDPEKHTELIISINLEFSVKDLKTLNKSFHYFKAN